MLRAKIVNYVAQRARKIFGDGKDQGVLLLRHESYKKYGFLMKHEKLCQNSKSYHVPLKRVL